MKIQQNKNNNINEESMNSLKDFRKKQIATNIRYYMTFIVLLFIINIGLTIFIIIYKSKISSIKAKTKSYNTQLETGDEKLSNTHSILMHKMVNMACLNEYGLLRFSFIFETSEEFNTIKNIIYDYRIEVENRQIPKEFRHIFLLFQGVTDEYESFIQRVSYYWNLALFIETTDNKKFGVFIDDLITPDQYKEYQADINKIFVYSFETKKKYNYIGDGKNSLKMNVKDKMFVIGDDELVIYNDYYINGGEINFPMKSFDFSTVSSNILTGQNGKFHIKNVEAFCFSQFQF